MKYFSLVWAGLWRKPVRTILTMLSIAIAFLLFGLLQGINQGMNHIYQNLNVDRLYVQRKIGMNDGLPLSQWKRIQSVPGVSAVTHWSYFGGFFQDAQHNLPVFAVDARTQFAVYPKIRIPKEQIEAMANTRTGAIVSKEIAAKYGWKIGDRIPLRTSIWTKKDGADVYPVDIVGIMDISAYNAGSFPGFLINYDYLNEERAFAKDFVLFYVAKIDNPRGGAEIANAIDAQFANSTKETATQTEQAFAQSQMKQVGDIGVIANSIVGAVLFALLFLTGNTMMQSVREREPELAVLKTLGFSSRLILSLVLLEAVVLCSLAALFGLALARFGFLVIGSIFGILTMPPVVIGGGLALATGLALISGLPPAWRTTRIRITDALAGR